MVNIGVETFCHIILGNLSIQFKIDGTFFSDVIQHPKRLQGDEKHRGGKGREGKGRLILGSKLFVT